MAVEVTVVRCRPGAAIWFLFIIGLLFTGLLWVIPSLPERGAGQPIDPNGVIAFRVLAAACSAGMLVFIAYVARASILADETGIRWRYLLRWRSAHWSEVSDFYVKRLQKGRRAGIVETPAGRLMLNDIWTKLEPLKHFVAEKATGTLNREWAERGDREREDWPLTFRYDTSENRVLRRVMVWLPLIASVFYGWLFYDSYAKIARDVAAMGPSGAGIYAFSFAVMASPLAMLALLVPVAKDTVRRRGQKIVVTDTSLTYCDGDRTLTVPWNEVVSIHIEPAFTPRTSQHILDTRRGGFSISGTIDEPRVVGALLRKFAGDALDRGKTEHPDKTDVFSAPVKVQVGERVFHYRTRTNRALLWFVGAFPAVALLMAWLNHLGLTKAPPDGNLAFPIGLAAVLAAPLFYWWWRYRVGVVRVDAVGITQRALFGERHIDWPDVREFGFKGDDVGKFGVVTGSKDKIACWTSISDLDDLLREIKDRAYNCRDCDWKTRDKKSVPKRG